jgi:hypothetical protein
MTTTTFAEYAAAAEARKDIAAKVLAHSLELCEALRTNYINYSIRQHERSIDKLEKGICDADFTLDTGRKYHKIWYVDGGGSRSCHAFIDKKTGEVYKPASYKAPAKGVRFNLLIIKEREYLLNPANCDWAGGYLYRNSSYFCS